MPCELVFLDGPRQTRMALKLSSEIDLSSVVCLENKSDVFVIN